MFQIHGTFVQILAKASSFFSLHCRIFVCAFFMFYIMVDYIFKWREYTKMYIQYILFLCQHDWKNTIQTTRSSIIFHFQNTHKRLSMFVKSFVKCVSIIGISTLIGIIESGAEILRRSGTIDWLDSRWHKHSEQALYIVGIFFFSAPSCQHDLCGHVPKQLTQHRHRSRRHSLPYITSMATCTDSCVQYID